MAEEAAALLERLAAGLAAAPSGGSPALSSSDGSDRPAPCEESPCCWSLRGGKEKRKGRDSSGGRHEGRPALRPAFRPPGLSLLLPYASRSPVLVLPLFRPAEFCAGVRIQGRVKTPPPIGIYSTHTMSTLLFPSIAVSPLKLTAWIVWERLRYCFVFRHYVFTNHFVLNETLICLFISVLRYNFDDNPSMLKSPKSSSLSAFPPHPKTTFSPSLTYCCLSISTI